MKQWPCFQSYKYDSNARHFYHNCSKILALQLQDTVFFLNLALLLQIIPIVTHIFVAIAIRSWPNYFALVIACDLLQLRKKRQKKGANIYWKPTSLWALSHIPDIYYDSNYCHLLDFHYILRSLHRLEHLMLIIHNWNGYNNPSYKYENGVQHSK